MEEISVQNNPIKVLSSFAFAGIRNVSSLMLGHNQLSVIEGSAFAATEMIQMLILNNNPIKVSTFFFRLFPIISISQKFFSIFFPHTGKNRNRRKSNLLP